MACLRLLHLHARSIKLRTQRLQFRASLLSALDPVIHQPGNGRSRVEPLHIQACQHIRRPARERLQAPAGELHVLQRLQLLRQRQIQARLGLVDIGARTRSRLQALARGIQLRGVGGLLRLYQQHLILRQ